jgi:hypothetical protein
MQNDLMFAEGPVADLLLCHQRERLAVCRAFLFFLARLFGSSGLAIFASRSAPRSGTMALFGGTPSPIVRLALLRFLPPFWYAVIGLLFGRLPPLSEAQRPASLGLP